MRNIIFALVCIAPALSLAQEMPAAPKELDVFKPMIGKWMGKMTWDMQGEKTEFTMTMDCAMEGMFLVQKNTMEMMGMKMTETCYMGWDGEKGKYKSTTFTNWAPTPRIEWGTIDAKGVSGWTSEHWDGGMGGKTESRATITPKNAKTCDFLLEFKADGKYSKVMSGTLAKQ